MIRARTVLLLVALAASSASIAGCGGAGPASPAGSTTPPAASSSPSGSASPSASGTALPDVHSAVGGSGAPVPGSTAPTVDSAVGVAACTGEQLQLVTGRLDSGAGQRYLPVTFRNTGAKACALRGYPGVDGVDAAGRATSATREPGQVTRVVLRPHSSAWASVHATSVPRGNATACPGDFLRLRVTPPETRTTTSLRVNLPACGGLQVSPVHPGLPPTLGVLSEGTGSR